MIDVPTYLAFVAACIAIVIVPGPTVTVIIANSLRSGAWAGLLNVAGTQAGLIIMVVILALGLAAVVEAMSFIFDYLRIAGAAYLVWLGVKLWRADGSLVDPESGKGRKRSGCGYFWQGFLVIWSNPKALLFFGAFIPQFVDAGSNTLGQTLLLGLTFMVVATLLDGAYAVGASRLGNALSRSRVRLVERLSGSLLIAGGIWLAFARR